MEQGSLMRWRILADYLEPRENKQLASRSKRFTRDSYFALRNLKNATLKHKKAKRSQHAPGTWSIDFRVHQCCFVRHLAAQAQENQLFASSYPPRHQLVAGCSRRPALLSSYSLEAYTLLDSAVLLHRAYLSCDWGLLMD